MNKKSLPAEPPEASQLLAETAPSAIETRTAASLASGHTLLVDAATSRLQIKSPSGRVELTVRCTDQGCVLEFSQGEIELNSPAKVSLQCDELELRARTRMELATAGDLHTRVAGDSLAAIQGRAYTEADSLELRAARGDAHVHANDRVRLVGEKILLNSEHERITTHDQLRALWKDLGIE